MAGSISVVYLCWLPYGIKCFNDFIDSYKKFDAGINHDLVIVFKGAETPADTSPFIDILKNHQILFQQLSYTGDELDVATYYWTAKQLHCEYMIVLNSRSRILTKNWLLYYYSSSKANPKTVLSATGSWQSYISSVFAKQKLIYEKKIPFGKNVSKYKLFIKAATLWYYYFPLFPNPHIRTNAFFINRELFISLSIRKIVSKIDAYRFESGRHSFTNQLKKKGYEVALLSNEGRIYSEKEWPMSNIFWKGNQENLIIADNQTEIYLIADIGYKKLLSWLAWRQK